MVESLNRFFKSLNFLKAIIMAMAMVLPVFVAHYFFQNIEIGFSIALGVIFCSPPDVPGSVKHNFYGILSAILLSVTVTILVGYTINTPWVLFPLLGVIVFLVSYLSVYGFRASLISFGGLLATVLTFSNDYIEMSVLTHAMLVGVGGLWYLSLSMLKSVLFPKAHADFLFIEITEKTAEFLRIRGELLICSTDRSGLYTKLFQLQSEITAHHEVLRTIILSNRKSSEFSNRIRRQQLFFTELVDILELAISNPVDYDEFDLVFKKHQDKIKIFKELLFEMANQLEHVSKVIRKEKTLQVSDNLEGQLEIINKEINDYRILVGLPKSRVGTLMLLNFKKYQEKQIQNITGIKRILGNYSNNNKILNTRDSKRFITPQDYDFKKFKENFNFKSPIFKHALRLTIVFLVGFLIGQLFEMENPYWILLTIIVIMRPSYGLTKERSQNRVVGTLIGAAIATVIILVTQNMAVYATISIVSLPIALSMMQRNYRNGAAFITLHVIFSYAIFEPDILGVIKFRIFDTIIGAFLSFLAFYLLFPSWGFQNISSYFVGAIRSNKKFLEQISNFYHEKGEVSTEYKLSRKDAFLEIGNLNAAFETMNRDPKSKQKDVAVFYELVVVSNTFLSSLSSLGTFIRHNKTTDVPKQFDVFVENIIYNLELSCQLLEENDNNNIKLSDIEEAQSLYKNSFENLANKRDAEIAQGIEVTDEMVEQLKETHLVYEQVKWLYNLSTKMVVAIKSFKNKT